MTCPGLLAVGRFFYAWHISDKERLVYIVGGAQAGVVHGSSHDLRHTFGDLLDQDVV